MKKSEEVLLLESFIGMHRVSQYNYMKKMYYEFIPFKKIY